MAAARGRRAYYHHGQVEADRWSMPLWEALEEITETDRPLRVANQARLRELLREHGEEVTVFSAHDPWAYAHLLEPERGAELGDEAVVRAG